MNRVPQVRIQPMNDSQVRSDGDFVLYWMTAFRRAHWNFSLQRAVEWAEEFEKPLVVLEALRCDYPWASDRIHSFILNGIEANQKLFERTPVYYFPYVEKGKGEGKGLLQALSSHACVVVTDDFPAFFFPRMLAAAAKQLNVRTEKVDSNGLLPMRVAERVFSTAYSFRRFLQKSLPEHLLQFPEEDPVSRSTLRPISSLPDEILRRWPPAQEEFLKAAPSSLRNLPIDHGVQAVDVQGGSEAARATFRSFLLERLQAYPEARRHPDEDASSHLSPYLHFGHISVHEIFAELGRHEGWSHGKLAPKATGQRAGWWNMSEAAEAFLDELITWRELGFNMCSRREDYDRLESLPDWALKDLLHHAADPRPYVYSLQEFEKATTHDPLWNAAQVQLLREGRIHNTLRMLWGKKILQWSGSPQEALKIMIELNNRYALDGRDPNSYTGIFWVLGRYDRPWGPLRPILGRVRFMSSRNTMRKVRAKNYLQHYGIVGSGLQ